MRLGRPVMSSARPPMLSRHARPLSPQPRRVQGLDRTGRGPHGDWKSPPQSAYLARGGEGTDVQKEADRRPSRVRAAAWLSGAGLRPTRQRLALAELLVGDGRNRHVTAEGLHEAARRLEAPVSLATVYNTLRAFCRAGLMHEVTVDGTRSYFD